MTSSFVTNKVDHHLVCELRLIAGISKNQEENNTKTDNQWSFERHKLKLIIDTNKNDYSLGIGVQ